MTEDITVNAIMEAMAEKKGEDIIALNLQELEGTIANYFVICSASSSIQVGAIASNIAKELLEKQQEKPFRIQGQENSLWITIDYGNIVAHVFLDEIRDFYKLEQMWHEAATTKYTEAK